MKSRKILVITSLICIIAVSSLAVYLLYNQFFSDDVAKKNDKEIVVDNNAKEDKTQENNNKVVTNESDNKQNNDLDIGMITEIEPIASSKNNEEMVSADAIEESKIMSSTRIEYQNYYTLDEKLEIEKEIEPPYYMLNLTREQIEEFYPEFQLIAFSPKKVVLRKIIQDHSDKYYIIKKHNNSVAVYRDYRDDRDEAENIDLDDYLRDTIDISVKGLVQEEQEKLKEGIIVYGEEELTELLKKLRQLYKFNESGKYILREHDGMMGIFYDYKQDQMYSEELQEEQLNTILKKYLRKVIENPTSGLEDELLNRLKEGITVNGEEELIRLLENYTS